jgi:hypothetical protein
MNAANHRRPRKHAWHGELRRHDLAEDILAHGNHLLRVMRKHRCGAGLPIQSNRPAFRILLAVFFLFVVTFAAGQTSPPAAGESVQSATAPVANTPSPDVSKYVGAETCKTCHEEIYNAWAKTPHWKTTLNTKGGPSKVFIPPSPPASQSTGLTSFFTTSLYNLRDSLLGRQC